MTGGWRRADFTLISRGRGERALSPDALRWVLSPETRRAVFVFSVLALVYFYGLQSTGMLGPDEPRYAAIGREMAKSGDWVTPRLWGTPWFEKSPLLYWMTALATLGGLGPDVAPRLPVATLGFGFLLFFYAFLRREFDESQAFFATCILGTSAGWIAYSLVGVTDIPMSVCFCAALLLALRLAGRPDTTVAVTAGALLGLAVLAKGLVPLALFLPALYWLRKQPRDLLMIVAACVAVAAPWYVLCTLRNGRILFDEFIVKHHFQRVTSDALQHVRPFWFYIPVLLAGLFPWTPVFALLRPRFAQDPRLKLLALWAAWGFLLFSVTKNKLPGYVLPILPVLAILMGAGLAGARRARIPLALAALLIAFVPAIAAIVPAALQTGLSRAGAPPVNWLWMAVGAGCAATAWFLETRSRRADAAAFIALALAITVFKSKLTLLPALDQTYSARAFYKRHSNWLEGTCLQDVPRDQAYGLAYYLGKELPVCPKGPQPSKVQGVGGRLILLD